MATISIKSHTLPDGRGDRILVFLASIASLYLGYALFIENPQDRRFEGATPIAQLKTTGTVRRRHAGSLHWNTIAEEENVYLRDTIYVPKGTWATLTWSDRRELTLEPDSMVQLDEVTLDRINIVLFEGRTKTAAVMKPDSIVEHKQELIRLIPYPKSAKTGLLSTDISFLELDHSRLLARLKELKGKPLTLASLKPVVLPSLALNRLTDYELRLAGPAPEKYNLAANRWVKMSWIAPPLAGVTYDVEVSRDKDFKRALSQRTTATNLSIQFSDAGTYYWRVKGTLGRESVYSESWNLSMVERGGLDPFADRLGTSRPKGFLLEIALDPQFKRVINNITSTSPICAFGGLKPGNYYCRVREISSNAVQRMYPFTVR